MTKQSHYFAGDGNYGAADKVIIIETTHWDSEHWEAIEEAHDSDRFDIALEFATLNHG